MLLRTLLIFLSCSLALPTLADTVWLNNGDRLSGDIILLDGGKLALKTKYAGRVLIDWADIDTLSSDQPLLVKRSGFEGQHSQRLQAAEAGQVQVLNGQSQTVALADIKQLVPPRPLINDFVWEGNLDAKLELERNQDDTDEFKLKGDSRVSHGAWRHVVKGELEHETKNTQKVEQNWQLDYDLDRFITEQWFVRSSLHEERNEFESIDRKSSYGIGPGYRFWDDELGRFELIAQYQRYRLHADVSAAYPGDISFDAGSMEWDYKRLLAGTRVELYSTGQLALPLIDQVDYVFEGEAGLRYRVNEWARISLLYELNQTRGLGQTSADRQYMLGLGIGW
ncbi:MAG: DUF481 domain-containing protein [Pseudomonas sp.]|uniref:DUF481 domain-containing protein n=1 Tax=Pseudomonas sp. TaxID=306 RepID=UPI002735DD82|nr:DUF481 domain-containing protein [Pseudomonas sp.]MDP3846432.1 DUF481 domain-containing protein [Pseudomonas sp.]